MDLLSKQYDFDPEVTYSFTRSCTRRPSLIHTDTHTHSPRRPSQKAFWRVTDPALLSARNPFRHTGAGKAALARLDKAREIFAGLGVVLGHCLRESGGLGVDFPTQVWCLLMGHPLSRDWRDWCDGEGADQQRVRRSCEQILELPDASVLGLDFTAPVEQRGIQGEGVPPRGGGDGRSWKDRREAAKAKKVVTRDMPLVKGGEKVPLTNANRDEYVLKWVRASLLQGAEEALLCMKVGPASRP